MVLYTEPGSEKKPETVPVYLTLPYRGSCIASGSSGFRGSGRGACANMSVVSTDGILLIINVGSWNMVLTEAAETTGIVLKL